MAGDVSRHNGSKGGRPLGRSRVLTQRKLAELHARGISPVDVMLDNMLFWHNRVTGLTSKLEELFPQISCEEDIKELNKLLGILLMARDKSQLCAVDLAPYCHPRLAALAIQQTNTSKIKVTGGLPRMPVEGESFDSLLQRKLVEERAREPQPAS